MDEEMTIPLLYGMALGFCLGIMFTLNQAIRNDRKINNHNNDSMLWVMYIANREVRISERIRKWA